MKLIYLSIVIIFLSACSTTGKGQLVPNMELNLADKGLVVFQPPLNNGIQRGTTIGKVGRKGGFFTEENTYSAVGNLNAEKMINKYLLVDPGLYEIISFGNRSCQIRTTEPSYQFEVKAGEVIYIGSFFWVAHKAKNFLNLKNSDKFEMGCYWQGLESSLYAKRPSYQYRIRYLKSAIDQIYKDFPRLKQPILVNKKIK